MSRSVRVLVLAVATMAVAAVASGCGTQNIQVSKSDPQLHTGAQVFSQRCGGCHTLSYAATNGSAPNIRTAQANSGPNFNVRCERPITRVLYAIENGGFSGAIMPQNVVVGQDALDVAKFVSTYAGRQEPKEPGTVPCVDKAIGTLPPGSGTVNAGSSGSATTSTAAAASATTNTAAAASATTTSSVTTAASAPAPTSGNSHKRSAHS